MFWGRLRSALSPIFDIRTRLDVMRDELEERACERWYSGSEIA